LCQFVLYLVGNCVNLCQFGEGFLLVYFKHFIKEKILPRKILLNYVSTTSMAIHILTNPSPQDKHMHYMFNLWMHLIPQIPIIGKSKIRDLTPKILKKPKWLFAFLDRLLWTK
jgi:hypothetical protein